MLRRGRRESAVAGELMSPLCSLHVRSPHEISSDSDNT